VVLGFGVFVTYSKHLHIGLAPLNVLFSRRPDGLRALQPMRSGGKVLDFEEADPDTDIFGIGKIEDLSWKGLLDLATCTECGRCQSQCPAWATGKPLSPKQLIMDLRDHALREGAVPAGRFRARHGISSLSSLKSRSGTAAGRGLGIQRRHRPRRALVLHQLRGLREECPVDIEHIDHITACAGTRC
jgi:ferredoxin